MIVVHFLCLFFCWIFAWLVSSLSFIFDVILVFHFSVCFVLSLCCRFQMWALLLYFCTKVTSGKMTKRHSTSYEDARPTRWLDISFLMHASWISRNYVTWSQMHTSQELRRDLHNFKKLFWGCAVGQTNMTSVLDSWKLLTLTES